MTLVKSISGIRGIVGKSLNSKVVEDYIHAFSNILPPGAILLARDTRKSGYDFISRSQNILNKLNRPVFISDIIPTPTAQFMISNNEFVGGIVFTASHNPSEWNGLKFINSEGIFIDQNELNRLEDEKCKIKDKPIQFNTDENLSFINNASESINEHIQNILSLSIINKEKIRKKQFKVVVDCVNGATSEALPILLENLNCNVVKIHSEYNENFERAPEPIPKNLNDLSYKVLEHNADIGFATDPDGDRLSIVDNKGIAIGEEFSLALSVYYVLKYFPDFRNIPIITNLSTSLLSEKIAEKYKTKFIRTPVGEINVVKEMKKNGSLIGGEGNGGVILKESHLGRDSLVGTALILNLICNENIDINKIADKFPKYYIVKSSKTINKFGAADIKKIKDTYPNEKIIETDGIKIAWEDQWVHIRKSNTEPILRIISESESINKSHQIIDSIKELLN